MYIFQVDMNENLPSFLCIQCFDKLLLFHEFREMCFASDKVYREKVCCLSKRMVCPILNGFCFA